MTGFAVVAGAVLAAMVMTGARAAPPSGDAARGAQLYRTCIACHSLVTDRNMTGPSLAGIWQRQAGSLESFRRYSPALKATALAWDEKTLDEWLKSPAEFVPGNRMTFLGMPEARQRADLIAFLKAASSGRPAGIAIREPGFQDLKKLGPGHEVRAIRYCRDTYHVTTADGQTADFWEVNLRFKTDSTETGPVTGRPAILPAGMQGDRASVFFASPDEIGTFIKHQC
jgi:cytochrome c